MKNIDFDREENNLIRLKCEISWYDIDVLKDYKFLQTTKPNQFFLWVLCPPPFDSTLRKSVWNALWVHSFRNWIFHNRNRKLIQWNYEILVWFKLVEFVYKKAFDLYTFFNLSNWCVDAQFNREQYHKMYDTMHCYFVLHTDRQSLVPTLHVTMIHCFLYQVNQQKSHHLLPPSCFHDTWRFWYCCKKL